MSRTRSPANGSAACAVLVRLRAGAVRGTSSSMVCPPSRGAASGGRRRPAPSRKGGRGFIAPSRGFSTKVSRFRKCSNAVTFEPLAIGAFGIRKADARSRTSSTRVRCDPSVDSRRQRRTVQKELRILHPLGVFHHRAEVEPLLPGPTAETDQPVAGRPDARCRHESLAAHGSAELVVEGHGVVGEGHRQRLEHRHVDQLAARVGAPTRGQGPDRAENAGDPLPDLATDEDRRTVGSPAGQPHDRSGPRLQREFGGGLVTPRALEPERRDARDGQVRVPVEDLTGGQRRVLRHRGTLRPHDGVGRCEQPLQDARFSALSLRQRRSASTR